MRKREGRASQGRSWKLPRGFSRLKSMDEKKVFFVKLVFLVRGMEEEEEEGAL